LNAAAIDTEARRPDYPYLLVNWKQFHRTYQERKIHIRIFPDQNEKKEDEVIIIPVNDDNLILQPEEDVFTKDLRDYAVHQPYLSAILNELLKPIVVAHHRLHKHYVALRLVYPGLNPRWKLLSGIYSKRMLDVWTK